MRSKNVEDWKPEAFKFVRITDNALRRSIQAANSSLDKKQQEHLREELQQVVMMYLDVRHSAQHPSALVMRNEFTTIAKKAKEFHQSLKSALVVQGLLRAAVDDIPKGYGRVDQARKSLDASILGVQNLESWAETMAREAGKAVGEGGHQPDHTLDRLLHDLSLAYECAFDRTTATSVGGPESPNAGKAGGPFIRFVKCALRICATHIRAYGETDDAKALFEISSGAIRQRWRHAESRLAEVAQRLSDD